MHFNIFIGLLSFSATVFSATEAERQICIEFKNVLAKNLTEADKVATKKLYSNAVMADSNFGKDQTPEEVQSEIEQILNGVSTVLLNQTYLTCNEVVDFYVSRKNEYKNPEDLAENLKRDLVNAWKYVLGTVQPTNAQINIFTSQGTKAKRAFSVRVGEAAKRFRKATTNLKVNLGSAKFDENVRVHLKDLKDTRIGAKESLAEASLKVAAAKEALKKAEKNLKKNPSESILQTEKKNAEIALMEAKFLAKGSKAQNKAAIKNYADNYFLALKGTKGGPLKRIKYSAFWQKYGKYIANKYFFLAVGAVLTVVVIASIVAGVGSGSGEEGGFQYDHSLEQSSDATFQFD